jgi:galactose mutarotase-like enzyme
MNGEVALGTYKDVEAVVLENDFLRVAVVPECGSKIASMVYKPRGLELFWQNPALSFRKSAYADDYELGDISAFDEMFPTISRCFYERFPWAGTEVPDHGEVWSIPWDLGSEFAGELGRRIVGGPVKGSAVNLSVRGIQFPYKLTKRVALEGSRLRIDYTASNLSGFELDYIWAAHPLFNAAEGMELIVPRGMDRVVNTIPSPRLGGYGRVLEFPIAWREDGTELNLGEVPAKNDAGYQKYWFLGKATEGWCMLHDKEKSLTVGMSYPVEKVPYLGVWLNEGGWEGQYNIAPEPATGAMDRIDFSRMWGMNSVLKGRQTLSWHLCISVMIGEKPSGMRETGDFTMP